MILQIYFIFDLKKKKKFSIYHSKKDQSKMLILTTSFLIHDMT